MNPTTTEFDTYRTIPPILSRPNPSWIRPVRNVNSKVASMIPIPYFSGKWAVRLSNTMQSALVGPVTRWLELPRTAATVQVMIAVYSP